MEVSGTYRIGEIARRAGTHPRTIRYYESVGLLPKAERNGSNYRVYTQADVERLVFIRSARSLGFGLDEIAEILAFKERSQPPCAYVLDKARRRVAEIDASIARLEELRVNLRDLVARTDSAEDRSRYCALIEHRVSGRDGV